MYSNRLKDNFSNHQINESKADLPLCNQYNNLAVLMKMHMPWHTLKSLYLDGYLGTISNRDSDK